MESSNFEKLAEAAWDEAAEIHRGIKHKDWLAAFKSADTYPIDTYLTGRFEQIAFQNKSVAQMSCNNGRELISIRLLGAGDCVGFDISAGALGEARDLDAAASAGCRFVKADCQALPDSFARTFDIVLVTAGALCFIPEISRYFAQAEKILAFGGKLIVFESHPFLNMFEMDRDRSGAAEIRFDYFGDRPRRHVQGIDYYTHKTYDAKEIYYFNHTLADIINAVIGAGLTLENIDELSFDPSLAFTQKAFDVQAPLGLALQFGKP